MAETEYDISVERKNLLRLGLRVKLAEIGEWLQTVDNKRFVEIKSIASLLQLIDETLRIGLFPRRENQNTLKSPSFIQINNSLPPRDLPKLTEVGLEPVIDALPEESEGGGGSTP